MDIIVPFSIRRAELDGVVSEEAKKIFEKVKGKPELAEVISARHLPPGTTLHKVYATTPGGARRLLFFCRRVVPPATAAAGSPSERWVLLFYRSKGDKVGDNMSRKNPAFNAELEKRLRLALADLLASTETKPLYEQF